MAWTAAAGTDKVEIINNYIWRVSMQHPDIDFYRTQDVYNAR